MPGDQDKHQAMFTFFHLLTLPPVLLAWLTLSSSLGDTMVFVVCGVVAGRLRGRLHTVRIGIGYHPVYPQSSTGRGGFKPTASVVSSTCGCHQ